MHEENDGSVVTAYCQEPRVLRMEVQAHHPCLGTERVLGVRGVLEE